MRAWMFSSVTSRAVPRERGAQRAVHRLHRRLDRQRQRLDAEVRGERQRVVDAAAAREGRRHQHAEHVRRRRAPRRRWRPSAPSRCRPRARAPRGRSRTCARSRACRARARARLPIRPPGRSAGAIGAARVEVADDHVGVERRAARDRRARARRSRSCGRRRPGRRCRRTGSRTRAARGACAAMLLSISSRRSCLPTVNGDADRLTIAVAPARTSSSTGSWW